MATQVQNRRGSTAEHSTFTGAVGELTVDTTKDTVVVHDGAVAGGRPLLREDQSNLPTSAPTTGIYNASGSLAISTGGSGRLFVDASGNVLVGNATSGSALVELQADGDIFFRRLLSRVSSGECNVYFNSGDNSQSKIWLGGNTNFGHGQIIYDDASDYLSFVANNQERLRITSAGLVGVGVSSPSSVFHARLSGTSTATIATFDRSDGAVSSRIHYDGSDGRITFGTNTNHPLSFETNSTRAVTIDTSQRVGVGTTSPAANLHIQATTGASLRIQAGSTNAAQIDLIPGGTSNPYYVYVDSSRNFIFQDNASERLRIDSSGRVGIGTSSPSNKFTIYEAAANPIRLIQDHATSSAYGIEFYSQASTPYTVSSITASHGAAYVNPYLNFNVADTSRVLQTRMVIDQQGRVGIGTTSASANLHVSASSGTAIKITETNNGVTGALQATSTGPALGSDTNHPLVFYTNAVEKARLTTSGQLLVGTSSQSGGALLQVNGDRVRIATAKTPASATDTGTAGEICWDASYVYVCTATNTWKRSALSTW